MTTNMAQIITSQLFLDYPIEHITLCISLVDKGMEEEMCRALLQWAARANRNKEMATLLGKLNFENISTPFILDVLCKDVSVLQRAAGSELFA
uniref:BACK domain-containing protein n=1 Tax=Ciona savignyi TaxID=51511 RepID=H2Y9E7_CIOSA